MLRQKNNFFERETAQQIQRQKNQPVASDLLSDLIFVFVFLNKAKSDRPIKKHPHTRRHRDS
jgi:hypothetical protein